MQKLLLTILFLMSSSIHAGNASKIPRLMLVPYVPVLADSISMADDKVCQLQAKFSAKALSNAKKENITLSSALETWDEFTVSDSELKSYTTAEYNAFRALIQITYITLEKYPDVTPMGYGKIIYGACANDKSLGKVKM